MNHQKLSRYEPPETIWGTTCRAGSSPKIFRGNILIIAAYRLSIEHNWHYQHQNIFILVFVVKGQNQSCSVGF